MPTLQLPPERNCEMASMVCEGTWAPAALSRKLKPDRRAGKCAVKGEELMAGGA
jgi:hypothetical protein